MEQIKNINNCHRDLILNSLEIYGKVHSLYCFAYVTRQDSLCNLLNVHQSHNEIHHYYLFAIMSNQNKPIVDLQNCVMQLLPEKIKVTLIAETPQQMEKKLKKRDVFSTNLIQCAECWYTEKQNSIIAQLELAENPETSNLLWSRRHQNANHLINPWSGIETDCESLNEITSYMLVLAIEQICLGITKQFFDYIPTSSNLNYLLDLCDIICPEITANFQRTQPEQKVKFDSLIAAQQKFRYSTTYKANNKHLRKLYHQTKAFINESDKFMQSHFKQQIALQETTESDNIEKCA